MATVSRATASNTSLDTRTYVQYNRLNPVVQPEHHLPPTPPPVRRLSEGFMVLPTTRCDQRGLDPMPRACDGRCGLIPYASRSNAFFASQQRVWRPAAKSHLRRPRHISKNIRSYWIWKATSKIVAYATKCALASAGINPRRPAASQIVVYATNLRHQRLTPPSNLLTA
jgi:hypothetical protein